MLFGLPRLPDLRMVIVTDSKQPGMLHVEDVIQAGESRHHRELMDLQSKLSFDDPINIQFTSVAISVLLGGRKWHKRGLTREPGFVLFVSGDHRKSEGSYSLSPQYCKQRLLHWFENRLWHHSKSVFGCLGLMVTSPNFKDFFFFYFSISLKCGYACPYPCTTVLARWWEE